MRVVYKKCVELQIDPLVAAAAFLRQNLGEIEVEVGEDEEERKPRRGDRRSREGGDGSKRSGKNRRDQHDTRKPREEKKPSRIKGMTDSLVITGFQVSLLMMTISSTGYRDEEFAKLHIVIGIANRK